MQLVYETHNTLPGSLKNVTAVTSMCDWRSPGRVKSAIILIIKDLVETGTAFAQSLRSVILP